MARSRGFKKYNRAAKDVNRLLGAVIGAAVKGVARATRQSGRRQRSAPTPTPWDGLTWADIPRGAKIAIAVAFGFAILVFVLIASIT